MKYEEYKKLIEKIDKLILVKQNDLIRQEETTTYKHDWIKNMGDFRNRLRIFK